MQTRPIDISFSLLRPSLFFGRFPSWIRTLRLPLPERIAATMTISAKTQPATFHGLIVGGGPGGGARD